MRKGQMATTQTLKRENVQYSLCRGNIASVGLHVPRDWAAYPAKRVKEGGSLGVD